MNQVGDGRLDQQAVFSPRTQHAIWADEDYDDFVNDWQSNNGHCGPLLDPFIPHGGYFCPVDPTWTVAGEFGLSEKPLSSKQPSMDIEQNCHASIIEHDESNRSSPQTQESNHGTTVCCSFEDNVSNVNHNKGFAHQTIIFKNEPSLPGDKVPDSLSLETDVSSNSASTKRKRDVAKEVDKFRQRDKKRIVKTTPDTSRLGPNMASVYLRSKDPPTQQFRNMFRSADDARSSFEQFIKLHQKPAKECSFPHSDSTFPSCSQEMTVHVRSVFDAICDWSYILEWKAVLPRQQRSHVIAQLAASRAKIRQVKGQEKSITDDLIPTEEELVMMLPSIEEQHKRVLSQIPSDQTMEWISWEVVHSKQLVKSLLSAGNGWSVRIANNPHKEFRTKLSNLKGNSVKGQRLQLLAQDD